MPQKSTHRASIIGGIAITAAAAISMTVAAGSALCNAAMNRNVTWLSKRIWGPTSSFSQLRLMSVEEKIHINKNQEKLQKSVEEWLDNVASERVHLDSNHGSIEQAGFIYYADVPSRKWVVLVHPYRMSHVYMQKYALMYAAKDFNVLAIDLVGCGSSEGNIMKLGADDSLDILRWVRYLVSRFGTDIDVILHGCSLGASAVLAASGRCAIPQVSAVISDSGFDSLSHIIKHISNRLVPHSGCLAEKLISGCAKQQYHMDISQNSASLYVASSQIPTLFLQGTKDQFITLDMTQNLYDACSAPIKSLHYFPEMGHLEAFDNDPQAYMDVVDDFLEHVQTVRNAKHIK